MYEYKATIMGYIFEEYLICRKCLWYVKCKKGKLITSVNINVKKKIIKRTYVKILQLLSLRLGCQVIFLTVIFWTISRVSQIFFQWTWFISLIGKHKIWMNILLSRKNVLEKIITLSLISRHVLLVILMRKNHPRNT